VFSSESKRSNGKRLAGGIVAVLLGVSLSTGCGSSNTSSAPAVNPAPQGATVPQGSSDSATVLQDSTPLSDLPAELSPDQAAAAGYFVDDHGMEYNQPVVDQFYEDMNTGHSAEMRVVRYTDDGDPVIADYQYDGEKFTVTYDDSRDRTVPEDQKQISVVIFNYLVQLSGDQTEYVLSNTQNVYTDDDASQTVEGLGWIPAPSVNLGS